MPSSTKRNLLQSPILPKPEEISSNQHQNQTSSSSSVSFHLNHLHQQELQSLHSQLNDIEEMLQEQERQVSSLQNELKLSRKETLIQLENAKQPQLQKKKKMLHDDQQDDEVVVFEEKPIKIFLQDLDKTWNNLLLPSISNRVYFHRQQQKQHNLGNNKVQDLFHQLSLLTDWFSSSLCKEMSKWNEQLQKLDQRLSNCCNVVILFSRNRNSNHHHNQKTMLQTFCKDLKRRRRILKLDSSFSSSTINDNEEEDLTDVAVAKEINKLTEARLKWNQERRRKFSEWNVGLASASLLFASKNKK